jgi:P-type Ca2+ transporter type 2C
MRAAALRPVVGLPSRSPPAIRLPQPLNLPSVPISISFLQIGYVGMAAAIATFIAMMIIKATGGGTSASATWASWTIAAFIYAITIVVVAIPEGLPLAVTISLAYSTGKMLQDKNLIRHLDACETMGNATDICTDKTGTLTENQMTVVEAWLGGRNYVFSTSLPNVQVTQPGSLPTVLRDLLRDQLALNSTAAIVYKEEHGQRKEEVKGSKTEGAGIKLVNSMGQGVDYQQIRDTYSREFRIIKQFAFSSERKMMSTIVELPDGRVRVFTTGGSDMVLSRCVSQGSLTADGSSFNNTSLTEADVTEIIRGVIEPMARQSLRTIAIAYRDFPNRAMLPRTVEELPEQELRLYGILGIKDPLRKGVTEAVDIAAKAGVRVRMVTGDNKITASAIAKECHILRNETDIVMEGPVFRTMTPAQLDMILPRLVVLARSSPKDKMILVRRLNGNLPSNEAEWKEDHPDGDWATQKDILLPGYYDEWKRARTHVSGNVARGVVGVTGDGTNDAPGEFLEQTLLFFVASCAFPAFSSLVIHPFRFFSLLSCDCSPQGL